MYNPKFLVILKTFNKEELKSFRLFLQSPIYNSNKNIIALFEYYVKSRNKNHNEIFSKDRLFATIFPKEAYNDKKLRILSSKMLSLIEKFLVYQHVEKRPEFKRKIIIEHFHKFTSVDKSEELLKELINNIDKNNKEFVLPSELLSNIEQIYDLSLRSNNSISPQLYTNILRITERIILDIMLKYYSTGKLISSSFKHSFNFDFFEYIYEYLEDLNFKNLPIQSQIEYYKLMLRKDKEENYFHKLIEIIKQKDLDIPLNEKLLTISFLLNFLVEERKIETFNNFCHVELDLRIEQIELMIKFRTYIPDSVFINTVYLLLRMNKFDETLIFIDKYKKSLNPVMESSVLNLSLGKLYSAMNNFEKSIEFFNKVKSHHWYYKTQATSNLVICFFELDDFTSVKFVSNQLKQLLNKKNNIYPFMKKNLMLFITYLLQYMILLERKDDDEIILFCREVKKSERFSYKEWLISKIELSIKKAA